MTDVEHAVAFHAAVAKLNEVIKAANKEGLEVKIESEHWGQVGPALHYTHVCGRIVRPLRG